MTAGQAGEEGGGCAAPDNQQMRCAPVAGGVPREGTGPFLRPQGCRRIALRATALRAALDPGDLYGPWAGKSGQAQACPSRGAARRVTLTAAARPGARKRAAEECRKKQVFG